MQSIILIDDDEVDVLALERLFDRAGVLDRFFYTSDCDEVLEILRTRRVDAASCLVLVGMNIPRTSCHEFLRAVRDDEALQRVVVIALTIDDDDLERLAHHDLAVAGHLRKPLTFEALTRELSRLDRALTFGAPRSGAGAGRR